MKKVLWLLSAVLLAIVVAVQVTTTGGAPRFVADAHTPTLTPGIELLVGIPVIATRVRGHDYRRAAFGEAWTDDTTAPGGHNGCDTRNDILDRDLVDKSYTAIKRCPTAVAAGTLHDPYTNDVIAFTRGNQVGAAVQIDHLLSAAITTWTTVCPAQDVEDMTLTGGKARS